MSLWANLAGRFKDLLTQSAAVRGLRAGLDPLEGLQAGLADNASRYVLDGSHPEVLLQVARMPEASERLGSPGQLYLAFSQDAAGRAAANSYQARLCFYAQAEEDGLPLEALVRMGKLLQAVDQGRNLIRAESGAPDWLYYLVAEGLLRDRRRGWSLMEAAAKKLESARSLAFSCRLLERLLAVEELESRLGLLFLFERKGINSYQHHSLEPLLHCGDLDPYLRAHRQELEDVAGQLSAAGKVVLAKTLATAKLAPDFERLLCRLAIDSGKSVREVAATSLSLLKDEQVSAQLQRALTEAATPAERIQAAELLSRRLGDAARPWLHQAAETETSKTVLEAIERALARAEVAGGQTDQELPPAPPFKPLAEQDLGAEALQVLEANLAELLDRAKRAAEQERHENQSRAQAYHYCQQRLAALQALTSADLQRGLDHLNGKLKRVRKHRRDALENVLEHGGKLAGLRGMSLLKTLRQIDLDAHHAAHYFWPVFCNMRWLDQQPPESLDLRAFEHAFVELKRPLRILASACLVNNYGDNYPMDRIPAQGIWPFFAEHLDYLREALGLQPSRSERYREFDMGLGLRVLACFPVLPKEFIPRLLELALGEGKTHRAAAQQLLQQLPDLGEQVLRACASSKQELRIVAIQWLMALDHQPAAVPLRKMLAKESKETVRAALLSALEHFGQDTSEFLAPAKLLAEANKGLSGKLPKDIAWFDFDGLPAAQWRSGEAVAPEILRWWVVLACKLKAPGGNALLERYLGLLDKAAAAALGRAVLAQFIAQDTRGPSLEEANAHAEAHADQTLAMYKQWVKYTPEYANYTRELVYAQLRQGHLGIYLGSAIGAKGTLALIMRVPGHELASTVGAFMRDHHIRRAQIEAMLEAMASSDDPAALQLLMAVSRRHRTASVQSKARELVDACAQRLGWSAEQLADRTIPSAGMSEGGELVLSYGDRQFVMTLDEAMKAQLRNPEGKIIKALPDARKDEDASVVKEAKAQFSAAKKELKQVLSVQSARLYEAMCAQRQWPLAEWQEYLLQHPIVGRLCQRLIWTAQSADGAAQCFRPSEDGALLDSEDEEISLADGAQISLAHAALLESDQIKAWKTHLKDYKIKPLFAQLDRPAPTLEQPVADGQIIDRQGWCADAFTLRGAFNKLGYQRAQAEDGGFFYEYSKDFNSLGIKVVVEFSGNSLPEENVAAALKSLSYRNLGGARYGYTSLDLAKVPPVLLAESYADYLQVAASGSGFDPAWESKMPW